MVMSNVCRLRPIRSVKWNEKELMKSKNRYVLPGFNNKSFETVICRMFYKNKKEKERKHVYQSKFTVSI